MEGRAGGVYWHLLQTNQAAEIAFNRYVRLFPQQSWNQLWAKKPNESEKTVYLTGYRQVTFKSGGEPDNLRAETLDGSIIDECREQPSDLWPMIIRPMLGRHKGWCDFYSTPNGFDWFYDLENEAIASPDEWDLFNAPSTEAWWWTKEEIESARRSMSEAQFAQEIMAEFRDLGSGKVYLSAGAHNQSLVNPFTIDGKLHPMLAIIVAPDFNINPMCWVMGQKKADQFYWFDEFCVKGTHTQEHAEILARKLKALNHKPGLIIAGDATANATRTSSSGQSDYDIMCKTFDRHGLTWTNLTPDSNPHIKDRVNTVNAKWRDATGAVNMWYHPINCPYVKKDVERVTWKTSSNGDRLVEDQTKDPELTHASSAIGYAVCALSPLSYDAQLPSLTVIRR